MPCGAHTRPPVPALTPRCPIHAQGFGEGLTPEQNQSRAECDGYTRARQAESSLSTFRPGFIHSCPVAKITASLPGGLSRWVFCAQRRVR